jgi:FMNH2-dependent dimethyl sulfone monooxygenase
VAPVSVRANLTGSDRFKLGLFSMNASGGIAMTRVPERWQAKWEDIAQVAQLADRAGLDFLLPLQRWRGYGGATDPRGWCMEAMTQAAALAGITERIALFATVQVSIVHPAWAARALATLDHASHGRAGLNIVCGWNEHDFAMFGAHDVGAHRRYDQGEEWAQIFARLNSEDDPFDHDGEFFTVRGAHCLPRCIQEGGPVLMSAAFTQTGREFAAKYCDVLFTTISNIENGKRHVEALHETAAHYGRHLSVYTPVHVVCRDTRAAAEAYYDYYATEYGDDGAVETYIAENSRSGKPALAAAMKLQRKRIAGGFGSYGIVGSPGDVADQILQIRDAGFCGISMSFVDFVSELPHFLETVMPRLEAAGIR